MSRALASEKDHDSAPVLPLFHGVVQVLELIRELYGRRHERSRARRTGTGDQRGLPMLCLVRSLEHEALLPAIGERLKDAEPHRVPHAYIRLEPAAADPKDGDRATQTPLPPPEVDTVRELLADIAEQLNGPLNAQAGRMRFPRFSLALWLMRQDLSGTEIPRREAELRKRLWRRDPAQRIAELINTNTADAPDRTVWSVLKVLALVPWLWFQIKLRWRLPFPGGYRWFRRQRYLAPEVPGNFLGFAERLTENEWNKEVPEQVAKFLTNTLLEDLRRSYRRFPWRLRGKWRTTYTTVLLDNVTRSNGGYALLKLVNDIRNETGLIDPLLLITTSSLVPPHAVEPTVDNVLDVVSQAHEANKQGYRAWRHKLAEARRARRDMTWYLPVEIPRAASGDAEKSEIRRHLAAADKYALPSPPWWSQRGVPATLLLAVLGAGALSYSTWSEAHCGIPFQPPWQWAGASPDLSHVQTAGQECVGVTDGTFLEAFIGAIPPGQTTPTAKSVHTLLSELGSIGEAIAQENQTALDTAAATDRPVLTLVYLGDLSPGADAFNLSAQHETLAGIAVAQANQNEGNDTPLVRVLIANGGKDMQHGEKVVQNQIAALAKQDPTIIGVVGLNYSRDETFNAIKELGSAGLPTVASTLSYDEVPTFSPTYFQVSPPNRTQAARAVEFAAQRGLTEHARIYRASARDRYSTNLADDVAAEFTARNPGTSTEWLAANPHVAGREACLAGQNDLVYYAGRGADFRVFLDGVAASCPNDPPVILGGDDVASHVANREARNAQRGIPYYFQSFAVAPRTPDPDDSLTDGLDPAAHDFYCKLNVFLLKLDQPASTDSCPPREGDLSLDGHAALAHDAASVLLRAADQLQRGGPFPITPGTVWRQINADQHRADKDLPSPYHLVTGTIDFGTDTNNRVPKDKMVWTLQVGKKNEVLPP
ncbi:hypothetical protein [Saccharopolyspora dendranthemae]|uniref:ABC-type branched-subunit amino acid transport system substrate-binding protein n=1 Tax=Saccharopolyspora dendranthemae TaxID=1181886 RepID=A0A561V885_9PSEU|nr:hypothetical protein [Saccharopolyspora dendranthemae]TWG07826.1 ABC-type branched-subunit amino acid transport system substrate-binding protein [Saccharopolyspora dendranthemae]